MISRTQAAGVAAIALASWMSSSARAQPVVGAPIIVPGDNTIVTIEFVGAYAAYTGELSFLGAGSTTEITRFVADTGPVGLGQQTFINHQPASGPITLEGVYSGGEALHFAYRVFDPADATDTLRTDVADTSGHFAWDASTGRLGVEDLRPDHPWYDADYDDIVVQVTFSSLPGPSALAALLLASMIPSRRRRLQTV